MVLLSRGLKFMVLVGYLPRLYCHNLNNYEKTRTARLLFLSSTFLPSIVDQYFLKAHFLGCECGRSR